jgi:tagatose-1,6-bisphosphate aldolase
MKISGIRDQNDVAVVLAFDQVVPIADHLGLNIHNPQEKVIFTQQLNEMMQLYSPAATGVVIAPELGFDALGEVSPLVGTLFSLERRLFDADPLSVPILVSQWGVEAVRNNYGVAKLELMYNPEEKEAATKKQIVAELFDYCQHEGIDLLLELVIYIEGTELEYKQRFSDLQLTAIQELRNSCSLLALEYPMTALGAVTVTAELDIPWIITARDTPYETFKEHLRTALESGATGFMAMEQFLPPLPATGNPVFNEKACLEFCTTIGRDRILELSRIASEAGERDKS